MKLLITLFLLLQSALLMAHEGEGFDHFISQFHHIGPITWSIALIVSIFLFVAIKKSKSKDK